MILKKLRKKLDSNWIKKNNIWDIVVYGSFSRGGKNVSDIDVAVILSDKTTVAKKMELSQELRRKLFFKEYALDVKTIDISDLMNPGFLGREAILAEGQSLLNKDPIAERFGFFAVAIIEYDLRKLTNSQKKMFYYAVQGRKKGTGILAKLNGKLISKGVFQVPTKNYEEIKSLLEEQKVLYCTTFVLQYRFLS